MSRDTEAGDRGQRETENEQNKQIQGCIHIVHIYSEASIIILNRASNKVILKAPQIPVNIKLKTEGYHHCLLLYISYGRTMHLFKYMLILIDKKNLIYILENQYNTFLKHITCYQEFPQECCFKSYLKT